MKRRAWKKQHKRAWERIHKLQRRSIGRHDRWEILAAHRANPWRFVPTPIGTSGYLIYRHGVERGR